MRWIVGVTLILFVLLVCGCVGSTPPWDRKQIENLKTHEVDCVPIIVLEKGRI